jgi:glycosyltransferase involved in cell wall biosynthesis
MLIDFPRTDEVSLFTEGVRPSVWLVMDLEAKKRGSIEVQLLALGRRLRDAGVAATFVFSNEPPPWMRDEFAAIGVTLRWLPFRRAPEAAWRWWQMLRATRPRLVHFHFVRAHSPLVAMARLTGARVLVHDHMALGVAFVDVPARSRALQVAVRGWKRVRAALCRRWIDRRLAVSRYVAESVRAIEFVPPERVVVLEHGIDLGKFAAVSGATLRQELDVGARPIVACVARLAPEKGVDVLLRAHARLGRDALLVLAGDGPDAARCRALAVDLGIAERVRFLGLRRDVDAILAACDVAVVPSQAPEAFGLSVVEAMAAGKPVVVSDGGAMPEIIDHGRCGTVVPAGDAAALADAIVHLLDGPVFAEQLGRAGRARAFAAYGLERWVDRVTAIYAEVAPELGDLRRPDEPLTRVAG